MPEDAYLDEVRSGKVEPRWAIQQLKDELPSEASLERIINVLAILEHEDEAERARDLLALSGEVADRIGRLLHRQIVADKEAYRNKLEYERFKAAEMGLDQQS